MPTYSKSPLSGSTNGRAIKVAATATPGTLIHTGPSSVGPFHEVWLYATNTDSTPRKLTLEWGGTTSPDDLIEIPIAAETGLVLVSPALMLVGNTTALVIRAFAETANVVTIHGYVNAVT